MLNDRSVALIKSFTDTSAYLIVMIGLLSGTTAALVVDADWIGFTALLVLAFMALVYGAVQTPEDLP